MNVGQAAMLIGASARMIRDLEQLGFIAKMGGTAGSRRVFSQMLHIVRCGRDLGFIIERALILLQLWRARSDADAGRITRRRAEALKRQITDIQAMVGALEHLASAINGHGRGDGPPLDNMADGKSAKPETGRARILPRGALRFIAEMPASFGWRASMVRT